MIDIIIMKRNDRSFSYDYGYVYDNAYAVVGT